MPENPPTRQYAVFISYRHADNLVMGRKWANWLHEALESYEVPPDLIGKPNVRREAVPASLYPVFRDEEELPADADLSTNIRRALEHSKLLVVLCSPRAVQSRFVADEIRYFKELGKSDRILALMIDGEPNASDDPVKRVQLGADAECFPEPLRFGVPFENEPNRIDWARSTEPIAADVRPGGRSEQGWTTAAAYLEHLTKEGLLDDRQLEEAARGYAERLELAKLKVIAGALGLPLGMLTQRDKALQLQRERKRAEELQEWLNRVEAEKKKQDGLLWSASRADHEAASSELSAAHFSEGIALLSRALAYQPSNRAAQGASLAFTCGGDLPVWLLRFIQRVGGAVRVQAISPDGRFAALGSADGRLIVFDISLGHVVLEQTHDGWFGDLAFCPRSQYLVVALCSLDGPEAVEVRVHEVVGFHIVGTRTIQRHVSQLSFSPDGRFFFVIFENELEQGTMLAMLLSLPDCRLCGARPGKGRLNCIAFSADGTHCALGHEDHRVCMHAFDGSAKRPAMPLMWESKGEAAVTDVVFAAESGVLAVGAQDNSVRFLRCSDGCQIESSLVRQWDGEVEELQVSPNGQLVAASHIEGRLSLFTAINGRLVNTADFQGVVWASSFSPDGRWLAAVSSDSTVTVFSARDLVMRWRVRIAGQATHVRFTEDARYLVVSGSDGCVRIYEPAAGMGCTAVALGRFISGVAFPAAPGHSFQSVEIDGETVLVSGGSSPECKARPALPVRPRQIVTNADQSRAVVAGRNDELQVIDLATGLVVAEHPVGGNVVPKVSSMHLTHDGRHVVAYCNDDRLRLLDLQSGRLVAMHPAATRIEAPVIDPHGRWVAFISPEQELATLCPETGLILKQFPASGGIVDALITGPEGGLLIADWSGPLEQTRVLSVDPLSGHSAVLFTVKCRLSAMALSPDGVLLSLCGSNKSSEVNEIHVWDVAGNCRWCRAGLFHMPAMTNFSVSGKEVAFAGHGGDILIMESLHAKILHRRENMATDPAALQFSADGRWLVNATDYGGEGSMIDCRWFTPEHDTPSAKWLQLLQFWSGMEFDSAGILNALSVEDLVHLQADIQTPFSGLADSQTESHDAVLDWLCMSPESRGASPWDQTPLAVATGSTFLKTKLPDRSFIESAASACAWHPLSPLSLARVDSFNHLVNDEDSASVEGHRIRTRFLARLTLKRLRAADDKLYGHETLAEYAAWSAKIMHEELHLEGEAREALDFAFTLTSPEKQKDLFELKAQLQKPKTGGASH